MSKPIVLQSVQDSQTSIKFYFLKEVDGNTANLLAAAPDLLEALKSMVAEWHRTHKGGSLMKFVPKEILDAEKAIAKAEGNN